MKTTKTAPKKKVPKVNETPLAPVVSPTPPVHKKRGPKPKYRAEFCDIIFEVAERGGHKAEMSKLMGINEDTFSEWCKTYPEFGKAWMDSKTISKAWWENLMLRGALGQIEKFNFNAVAMIMNNKFRDEYTRSANGAGTHIEITNNTLNMQDPRSIDEQIAQKLEHLNSLGVQLGPQLEHIPAKRDDIEDAEVDED